jgi:XTP/dITP diphosphohydrolase
VPDYTLFQKTGQFECYNAETMKLYFVSGNEGKIKEAEAILEMPIEIAKIDLDEIQEMDIEKIVQKKAAAAFEIVKKPLIVDDAGLYIDTWKGFPGPFVKFINQTGGNELLLQMMQAETNRKAYFKTAIGFHDGNFIHTFTGEVQGEIAMEKRGNEGWGYDPIFIVEDKNKTFAEMTAGEKNAVSHRKRALEKLKEFLKGI